MEASLDNIVKDYKQFVTVFNRKLERKYDTIFDVDMDMYEEFGEQVDEMFRKYNVLSLSDGDIEHLIEELITSMELQMKKSTPGTTNKLDRDVIICTTAFCSFYLSEKKKNDIPVGKSLSRFIKEMMELSMLVMYGSILKNVKLDELADMIDGTVGKENDG